MFRAVALRLHHRRPYAFLLGARLVQGVSEVPDVTQALVVWDVSPRTPKKGDLVRDS